MSSRIWYCCRVLDPAPLQDRLNGTHFRTGQFCSVSQVDAASWLLFDGRRYACVLTPDLAKAAMETRRDSQGQRVLAPKATEERFLKSVYGQTGQLTRKGRRFW
jgi:hypothetical protein